MDRYQAHPADGCRNMYAVRAHGRMEVDDMDPRDLRVVLVGAVIVLAIAGAILIGAGIIGAILGIDLGAGTVC